MIDIAATSLNLRASRRSTLKPLRNSNTRRFLLAGTVLVALGGGALLAHRMMGGEGASAAQSGGQNATLTPAIPVDVVTATPQHVRLWSEFSGKLDAVDYAEIRPEVSGRIVEIRFRSGQTVKAGDILFVIDPRPFEAEVAKAAADLQTARTNAALAKTNLARADNLRKQNAIALQAFDQAANADAVAGAAIQGAEAALASAHLDVDRAYVKAPVSGRIGRPEITLGNFVQAGVAPPPLLTSIVSDDGIYADFDVDEQTYIRSIHGRAGSLGQQQKIPVELTVQGDTATVYKGTIESFDNKISTATGTIRARARFDNKDGVLVPGMFVSVRLAGSADSDVMLIPERAIGTDQSKKFLFVVGADNKANFRDVTLGDTVDGKRIVTSGLKSGERVIVNGTQHVMPGAVVTAHAVTL